VSRQVIFFSICAELGKQRTGEAGVSGKSVKVNDVSTLI
jgi:hypothetical protein